MCKKLFVLALMISLCMLSACGRSYINDRDMDIYEKIHRYYSEMESYSADLKVTAYSNKTENTYTATQKTVGNDKFHVTFRSDNGILVTTVVNGDKTKTLTDESDYSITVPTKDDAGFLFVNRFFSRYYASEDTALFVGSRTQGNVTVLETELSENNPRFSRAKLTVDNKTLTPVKIELTDPGGNPVITGEFTAFRYNDTIEEGIFSIDE